MNTMDTMNTRRRGQLGFTIIEALLSLVIMGFGILSLAGMQAGLSRSSDDAKQLWTPKMFSNFTDKPGPDDISIYLRCIPRHYFFNDANYYETILNNTVFDKVWLFLAPECPTRMSDDASKDGLVPSVIRLLMTKFNAIRY